ncbi:DUF4595 domain-containing protein [Bacteroides sp. AN502(2024)]|uniref:DUF4595 domain-containing protein n=1 Tax=Bacteroides sp. AN502(2024) TaxID=3160599 RepID=UPI003518ECFA
MKVFRLIGMALLALCMNFASCSNDDDENNAGGTVVSGKLLLRMTTTDSGNRPFQFNYNEKRQLTSIPVTPWDEKLDIEWLNSKVLAKTVRTSDNSSLEEAYFTIDKEKGVVTHTDVMWVGDYRGLQTTTLTYDKDNHLIKTSGAHKCTWSWENGNVVKFTLYSNDGVTIDHTCTFTYHTDKENKHPVMDIEWVGFYYTSTTEMADKLFVVHPYLLGTPNKNLLKSVTRTDYCHNPKREWTTSFTYEFDSDGYPIKVIRNSDDSKYGNETYTLMWD